jgi:methylmalonyl-CoA/ethylmalonyl-CoA epimerase
MLTRIDHVGIACRDLDEKIEFYCATFGLTVVSREVNEEQGVREAMLRVAAADPGPVPAAPSYIQLLEPTAPGVRLIDERPRHGSMGASIAFLHPADVGGVLTELVEPPTGPPDHPNTRAI